MLVVWAVLTMSRSAAEPPCPARTRVPHPTATQQQRRAPTTAPAGSGPMVHRTLPLPSPPLLASSVHNYSACHHVPRYSSSSAPRPLSSRLGPPACPPGATWTAVSAGSLHLLGLGWGPGEQPADGGDACAAGGSACDGGDAAHSPPAGQPRGQGAGRGAQGWSGGPLGTAGGQAAEQGQAQQRGQSRQQHEQRQQQQFLLSCKAHYGTDHVLRLDTGGEEMTSISAGGCRRGVLPVPCCQLCRRATVSPPLRRAQ